MSWILLIPQQRKIRGGIETARQEINLGPDLLKGHLGVRRNQSIIYQNFNLIPCESQFATEGWFLLQPLAIF